MSPKTATILAENGDYSVYSRPAVWTRLRPNMFHDDPTEEESNRAFSNQ